MGSLKPGGNAQIAGVVWRPLRVISDDRGAVLHMLRADSPEFTTFGEAYFSELRPQAVKGWKLHLRMTQRLVVPVGRIRFVIFDTRPDSPTLGTVMEVQSGRPDHYGLLTIPPGLWYGFQNVGTCDALIANCADMMHDPAESKGLPLGSREIPFQWETTNAVLSGDVRQPGESGGTRTEKVGDVTRSILELRFPSAARCPIH